MANLMDYFCVFFKGEDPAKSKPVALFDRAQFLTDFIISLKGRVSFREEDVQKEIIRVKTWLNLGGETNDENRIANQVLAVFARRLYRKLEPDERALVDMAVDDLLIGNRYQRLEPDRMGEETVEELVGEMWDLVRG